MAKASAHRTAFAALKHRFEKVGDHWEPKPRGAKGPSDEQSARPRGQSGESYGGVDANASQQHLLGLARQPGVPGRSSMTKQELAAAIEKENDRRTAAARGGRPADGRGAR